MNKSFPRPFQKTLTKKYSCFQHCLSQRVTIFLFFFSAVFSENSILPVSSEVPVVSDLTTAEYFPVVLQTFQNAKKSIWIVLESLSTSNDDNYSSGTDPISKLVQALLLSSMEGVQVRVLLNRSNTSTPMTLYNPDLPFKNSALSFLQSGKISVQWTSQEKAFHSNLVIVDERIVIEGSQPWISKLDFTRQHYSNTLIVSQAFANKKIQTLQKLGFFKSSQNPIKIDKSLFYLLPDYFIHDTAFWMKDKDQRMALDFFLWLSQNSAFRAGHSVNCSIPVIAKKLLPKIQDEKKRKKTLLQWIKVLSKLGLIQKEKGKDKNTLSLQIPPQESKSFILFPANFVAYGFGEQLSFSEKLAYLVCCKFASQIPENLVFSVDKTFYSALSIWTEDEVNVLLDKLEKRRLIRFYKLFPLDENGPWIASYEITPPPDPIFIDKQFLLLDQQSGTDARQKAQFLASQLNQELNPEIVSGILIQMENHGFLETQKAFYHVMQLPRNHPQKNFDRVKFLLSQVPEKKRKR